MEAVYVSNILEAVAEVHAEVGTSLLGEVEGEYLFYALKANVMHHEDGAMEAPVFDLMFNWPSAFYSTEFFTTLFGFMVDDEACDYFGALLTTSDLRHDPEISRMVRLAFDRIGSGEVLA